MKYIKDNWKFLLFIIISGIIGGYFTVIYSLNSVSDEMMQKVIEQVGSKNLVILISMIQPITYAVVCGIIGIILSNKIGLWKTIKIEKDKLLTTIVIAIIGGLVLILSDVLIFGKFNDIIKHSFDTKPTIDYILMALIYGGVIEEVMLRLFFMSLISFIIYKLFYKKEKKTPIKVFVTANIISAILFAAGHLPSTYLSFGYFDGLLLFRCFLLNGIFGLLFGWLYRKYGIYYSMIAHAGCHLVSKLIWILFI